MLRRYAWCCIVLRPVMLNAVILSVIMLRVVMLIAMAPIRLHHYIVSINVLFLYFPKKITNKRSFKLTLF